MKNYRVLLALRCSFRPSPTLYDYTHNHILSELIISIARASPDWKQMCASLISIQRASTICKEKVRIKSCIRAKWVILKHEKRKEKMRKNILSVSILCETEWNFSNILSYKYCVELQPFEKAHFGACQMTHERNNFERITYFIPHRPNDDTAIYFSLFPRNYSRHNFYSMRCIISIYDYRSS